MSPGSTPSVLLEVASEGELWTGFLFMSQLTDGRQSPTKEGISLPPLKGWQPYSFPFSCTFDTYIMKTIYSVLLSLWFWILTFFLHNWPYLMACIYQRCV